MDLFQQQAEDRLAKAAPRADRMRPRTLDAFVGQEHLVGPDGVLRRMIEADELHSLILWGPPGTGKTTLALLVAESTDALFVWFSAVTRGSAREAGRDEARESSGIGTADDPLRRRDPPLQQGAAGRVPPARRERES